MSLKQGRGSFINNTFVLGSSISITSKNPSDNFQEVFSTFGDMNHVEQATDAAFHAQKKWHSRSLEYRIEKLKILKNNLIKNEDKIAHAISSEMGKLLKEAKIEAKGLAERIDLVIEHGLKRVSSEYFHNLKAKTFYQPQGVMAIIGPFNFPVHLIHSHVVPALLLGNSVVIKPSELCPLSGEIYSECFLGLDDGIFNMVVGKKEVGEALCLHKNISGVVFTGSYQVGRHLQNILLDHPQKILALEMGGKNCAVLMDDAHIEQALIGVLEGAFLTTGQRCTATSRVFIQQKIYNQVKEHLVKIASSLKSVNALTQEGLFGPLASKQALENFFAKLNNAKKEPVNVLLESQNLSQGAYVTPSIYEVSINHPTEGYLSDELFGPNICLEQFNELDEVIYRVNQSPYGLSNALFSSNQANFDYFYQNTKSGLLNFNRSTNRAFGQLPFGGVNKSGNQRPAGIEAVRYASFPVAICEQTYGDTTGDEYLKSKIEQTNIINSQELYLSHSLQKLFSCFGIYPNQSCANYLSYDKKNFNEEFLLSCKSILLNMLNIQNNLVNFTINKNLNTDQLEKIKNLLLKNNPKFIAKANNINVPQDLYLPKSQMMLDQLYLNNFVPKDKKEAVIDLARSNGAFLASIDDNPLVLIDAASQISSLVAGFNAAKFQDAYDTQKLNASLLTNIDLAFNNYADDFYVNDAKEAKKEFEFLLHSYSHHKFKSIAYGSSGAEANEIALDLARQNGPGGTKIIAFAGSFHGRTLLSLQATYNKEKRGPFVFEGYEAVFLPFPIMNDPQKNPVFNSDFLAPFYQGIIPNNLAADELLKSELEALQSLKEEILKGNNLAVIIEPMQCEGGDKYASSRFFNALRGLTRFYKVPLIFDEVQTGFHLGSKFFWHHEFNLINHNNEQETPDCVTLGKKAQLGVCLSVWENHRSYTPHVVQLKRGLLHALSIDAQKNEALSQKTFCELSRLKEYFPKIVSNIRVNGCAFAFDMPSNESAMQLINQRFMRGFMAYIAGEKTIRFRLNMSNQNSDINTLFENIFCALSDIKNNVISFKKITANITSKEADVKFVTLNKDNWDYYKNHIESIEKQSYEANRIDTLDYFYEWLSTPYSLGLVISVIDNQQEEIAGFAIGGSAIYSKVDGPKQDPLKEESFYSTDCVIAPKFRNLGLGKILKQKQLELVKNIRNDQGQTVYNFLCGRNRLGFTDSMASINDSLGAYDVAVYDNQYNELGAKARYYRLPLNSHKHQTKLIKSDYIDCQNSLQKIWHNHEVINQALQNNEFRSFASTKLTLSNWITPNFVYYAQMLRSLAPKELKHAYFTSGRDEVIDKGIRSIKYHRQEAQIVIGFSQQYFGNITAAARSLSHDEGQSKPFGFFKWPLISHPSLVGNEQSLKELMQVIETYRPQKILAIALELVGEKSGLVFDEEFLQKLSEIRKITSIPLIFCENASGFYRNQKSLFLTTSLSTKPNMLWFYNDAQLGSILVDDEYFVSKPLTLISTWDGDDISMLRSYYKLLYAANLNHKTDFCTMLKNSLSSYKIDGMGKWVSIKLNDEKIAKVIKHAYENKILLAKGFDNRLMICPPLDLEPEQDKFIIDTINEVL